MGLLRLKSGPFHRIGDSYATLFDSDHFLGRSAFEDSWMTKPPANLKEEERLVTLEMAMPGFTREEVVVELKHDMLHVKAEKKMKDNSYSEREIPQKIEPQVIYLSSDVDQDGISAQLENGMLTIKIPHSAKPSHGSRAIKVK